MTSIVRLSANLLVAGLLLAGCRTTESTRTADTAAIAEMLRAQTRAFSQAYMAQNLDAVAAAYTDSAFALPSRGPIRQGHDAIRPLFTLGDGVELVHHEIQPIHVRIEGDHAYDVGHYEAQVRVNGELQPMNYGKYVVVWQRGTDGAWRMVVDAWSPRPAPEESAP